jgi:hypothetical protein
MASFVSILSVSLVLLIPDRGLALGGGLLIVLAVLRIASSARGLARVLDDRGSRQSTDIAWRLLVPIASTGIVVAVGIALILGESSALMWLAVTAVALLALAVGNAWELLIRTARAAT